MPLPPSAIKQIEKLIQGMLPYESGYVPETPQSRILEELFRSVATPNPHLRQWAGFIMFLMKQIDNCPKKQRDVDAIAYQMYETLEVYGYGDEVEV